ncbi:MAG: flavodoxin family protein [Dysosmobacter sp.]
MEIKRVCALYFSATGNTEKTVAAFAETLAEQLGVPWERLPFTKPAERERDYVFADTDLVVVGTPTYAESCLTRSCRTSRARLHGNGALAAAIVTFGNRSYDNALAELCAVLEGDGFHTVAGGAFVGRHAFTDKLAEDRPDWDDRKDEKTLRLQPQTR